VVAGKGSSSAAPEVATDPPGMGSSSVAPVVAADPPPASSRWAPRITLLHRDLPGWAVSSSDAVHPVLVGWQRAESRGALRRHLHATRPPCRPTPADLIAKCFNCFSPTHTTAQCRLKTRCFHCQSLGHRSYMCPGVIGGGNAHPRPAPSRVSVWRRISLPHDDTSAAPRNGCLWQVWLVALV
jgi:hypothetical protein